MNHHSSPLWLSLTMDAVSEASPRVDIPVYHGLYASPFGTCIVTGCTKGICGLHFGVDREKILVSDMALAEQVKQWGMRIFTRGAAGLVGENEGDRLPIYLRGTPFQLAVWQALLKIPFGVTSSYSDIAAAIGKPQAVRAVGQAIGQNPIAFLVPCHRVLRKDGALGGYSGGVDLKRVMLAWEKGG